MSAVAAARAATFAADVAAVYPIDWPLTLGCLAGVIALGLAELACAAILMFMVAS